VKANHHVWADSFVYQLGARLYFGDLQQQPVGLSLDG
jgi:hypothetical protein